MESPVAVQAHQQHSPQHALPSITSLTNGLPPTAQRSPKGQHNQSGPPRDSGTWPHPQSKHSSIATNNLHVSTLLNPDDTQPRSSVPSTPTSARLSTGHALPSINQGFETGSLHRGSGDFHALESRRSSVDSRMHSGFNSLAINQPTSPYESQNHSQVSLAASLRRPNGLSQLSPISSRSLNDRHGPPRVAPPIVPIARLPGAPDPTAARPTQGYPWAFPDSMIPEERSARRSTSSDSSATHHSMSRQNSFAASSVRSSIFSADSHLPPGQRRFEDGMAYQKIIGDADGKPPTDSTTTHHHTMQHPAIASLQQEHANSAGNYSRTPELRVSHKLAERKRRSEMKDLFEELNKAVPANGGAKASKWEILSKAIEHIRMQATQERTLHGELHRLRATDDMARESHKENELLRTEICVMHERLRRLDPGTPHIYGQYTSQLTQHHNQTNGQSPMGLPPVSSHVGASQYNPMPPPPSSAMQGVEYGAPHRPSYELR